MIVILSRFLLAAFITTSVCIDSHQHSRLLFSRYRWTSPHGFNDLYTTKSSSDLSLSSSTTSRRKYCPRITNFRSIAHDYFEDIGEYNQSADSEARRNQYSNSVTVNENHDNDNAQNGSLTALAGPQPNRHGKAHP